MTSPRPPQRDEAARLRTLRALDLLDTAPEERFDRYTRLAQRLFGVPIAVIALVDEGREWLKSHPGLDAVELPRGGGFCEQAARGPVAVRDASRDARLRAHPLVQAPPHLRFFAACPISAPDGARLGALCVMDREARSLSAADAAQLTDLGAMVEAEIATVALGITDELTGLANRRGFDAMAAHVLKLCARTKRPGTLMCFGLQDLAAIEEDFGRAESARAMQAFAELMCECFRNSDVIARVGSDEFCVLLTGTGASEAEFAFARFDAAIHYRNATPSSRYPLAYDVGLATHDRARDEDPGALLERAQEAMRAHRRSRRKRIELRLASA